MTIPVGLYNILNSFERSFLCVNSHRGLSGSKKVPFRRWYGCLGELTSLMSKNRNMVLTATATRTSKQQILQTLNLPLKDVVFIQESPDRSNLVYLKQLLDNNDPLEKVFGGLIDDIY